MDDSLVVVLATVQHLVNVVLAPIPMPEMEESDSDVEETIASAVLLEADLRMHGPRALVPRNPSFAELVMRPDYPTDIFKTHFRMGIEVVHDLEARISHLISRQGDTGRPTVEPREQILATLWILANPDCYRSVGEKFSMGKALVHNCVERVVEAICSIAPDVIRWPSNEYLRETKGKFANRGFPGAIGAVDGTYIWIPVPKVEPRAYITRKRRTGIIAQGVSDADLHFTDFFVGYPGGTGDLRVFRNSDLCRDVMQNIREFFPNEEFIVGDKAYPCWPWCITPYKSNHAGGLTQSHHDLNTSLSGVRDVIERAWCLYKGRFRRMKFLDMPRVEVIPRFILACAVLHNLCLRGFERGVETDAELQRYIDEGREDDPNPEEQENHAQGNDVGEDPQPANERALDRGEVFRRWKEEGEAKRELLRLRLRGPRQ